ncbi:hypothetical protein F2Q70_00043769 [Brassica cretica]|uniref:Uncharacterized protein n=2 Tax=Brassica cretica TaxID=69181 RepID=A0A8S9KJX3_BRACR|nr:hypothetical protein F2Q70_00043769 [Brassica cretica]KAF2607073.1 hypothetical protein F2Q68_00044780 [Brassica cretica]KAF3518359.1 hypothetical protein DY000_02061130 [Brassica cretica]
MVVMTSVAVVVATPVKTDLRSDGGGDERWGTGEMAMVVTSGRHFFSFLYELHLSLWFVDLRKKKE